jgi:hypothetical protein
LSPTALTTSIREFFAATATCQLQYFCSHTILGFWACTDTKHCAAREKYAGLETNAARQKFVKVNTVRWTEFAHLPYFDLVHSVIIDPMHNLLLGKPVFFISSFANIQFVCLGSVRIE